MWSFVYYILEIKKSYISSHVHVYKSRLILLFLSSVFKFSSFSWSQLEIPHFLSFFVILFTHSISLPKKKYVIFLSKDSILFWKTPSFIFSPACWIPTETVTLIILSQLVISPRKPASFPSKKVFLLLFNPKPNHHLERCWCFAKNNVIFLTKTSLILHMVYSNPFFYHSPPNPFLKDAN